MANVGDKYIIKISEVYKPTEGSLPYGNELYRISGFSSLVFDEKGLNKLEKFDEERFFDTQQGDISWLTDEEKEIVYQQGLNDAWEAARKIVEGYHCTIDGKAKFANLFGEYLKTTTFDISPDEAISKIKAYEEQKKAGEEIKVGDEIKYKLFGDTVNAVVLQVFDSDGDRDYKVLCENVCGQIIYPSVNPITKTGKHYDIEGILKAMRERRHVRKTDI